MCVFYAIVLGMKMQNIIIAVLTLIILGGGVYIFGLQKNNMIIPRSNIVEDVVSPTLLPYGQSATTTSPPYVAPPEAEKVWADTTQSGKIDEHLTIDNALRDVNFCGKTYKVKQVLVDGVDVVQRIAEIAGKNITVEEFPQYEGTERICRDIQKKYEVGSELVITRTGSGKIEGGQSVYYIGTENLSFTINLETNYLFEQMGGPEYPDPGAFGVFIPLATFK